MGPGLFRKFSSKSRLSLPVIDDTEDGTHSTPYVDESVPTSSENPYPHDLISDLQRRVQNLEQENYDKDETIGINLSIISGMIEEKKVLESQTWTQLNQSKGEADILRGNIDALNAYINSMQQQIHAGNTRFNALNNSYKQQAHELSTRANTIQVLSAHNQKLQNRVAGLERVVASENNDTETNIRSIFDENAELKLAYEGMTSKLKSEDKSFLDLQDSLRIMTSENASFRTIIEELEAEVSSLEVCQPQSLRSLLTLRLVEQTSMVQPDDISAETEEVRNWLPNHIAENPLDKICSAVEMQNLGKILPKGKAYNQFYQRLRLAVCSVCAKAKFRFISGGNSAYDSMKWLNEYPDRTSYFSCCYEQVCKECFAQHLLDTLGSKWWSKLETSQWFSCPRDGCDAALGIRFEGDLKTCLERDCGIDAQEHIKVYVKTLAFRQALKALDPKPSDDTLKRAAELHQHLIKADKMYSLFDPRFDIALVDESGCIPEFEPGKIFNCVMDNSPSPVPLFLKFLHRQRRPKPCIVCSKAIFDIDYEDVETWKTVCGSFQGSWMWDILLFPTKEIQKCDHEFEACRVCTAEHIRGSLASGGPSACGNLSCPQCCKKLSGQEIRQLADPATFAKYDKFLLQIYLSNDESFRWCLDPRCENGQLYEMNLIAPKISCGECEFQMCFNHQMPWHDGMTCDEYENQRDHGDPNYGETQEWIRTNTKPCPGCQVGIQKGEACFHMTCSQCNHEFCWQCLAAWTDISARGQEGHAEGCFFRTNDIRPMGIRGENLEDALRARNAG